MKDAGSSGFERWLRSITLKPAPPALRERVLAAAAEYRERKAWTTPLLRRWLAVCAAAVLAVSVADGLMSGTQRSRLIALGGGPRPSPIRPNDEAAVLAEALGDAVASKLVAMESAAGRRRSGRRREGEDIRQLEILMEGADESQKDLH
jgi:hypothetical protein